ncbi:MAG TPA: hypothetical protein VJ063_13980 [Verrucomicrobiae bacterium]|nr:hypothetical protein [Verrucomicrobiae bacterium]
MPFRAGKCLVVLSAVLATGAHWVFLQSVAWVGMTVDFSRTEAIGTALQKTFDGQHPCALCKLVDEGRKAERNAEMLKAQPKLDLFCERSHDIVNDPLPFSSPVPILLHHTMRPQAPPVPPPRFA